MSFDSVVPTISDLLVDMQKSIYAKAFNFRKENTHVVDDYEEFKRVLDDKGGFIYAHWDGTTETEDKIKQETKATIRCIPEDSVEEVGKCIYSGKHSDRRVLFDRSYYRSLSVGWCIFLSDFHHKNW